MMIQELKNYLWHWPKAVVASAWYGWPARRLTVIGVTGTKGKTTTAHMIYHILRADPRRDDESRRHFFDTLGSESSLTSSSPLGQSETNVLSGSSSIVSKMPSSTRRRVGLISTIGAFFGNEEIDTGLHVTSPDSRELQRLLRLAVDKGLTHVILEVTSSGLDQFRVWGIKFRVAVVTNIYPDHLDYHGTMEKYVEAKGKIIRQSEVVVLSEDSPYFSELKRIARQNGVKVVVVGHPERSEGSRRDSSADGRRPQNDGMAAAAAEALFIKDSPWHTPRRILFRRLLGDFKGVKGRLEEVYKNKFSVVIDFAHTPESLAAALSELRPGVGKGGRLIAVFGCAGERDHGRRRMGQVAAEMADFLVITAEDPRSEKVEEISKEIAGWAVGAGAVEMTADEDTGRRIRRNRRTGGEKDGKDGKVYFVRIPDRQEAINYAIFTAKQGDVVGLFGKGHEKSMAFGKKELPWSEHEAVKKALVLKLNSKHQAPNTKQYLNSKYKIPNV